jgi:hypothetical protein
VDLYAATVAPHEIVSLGVHELELGDHMLAAKILGANEKAEKGYMLGLDWMQLKAVP